MSEAHHSPWEEEPLVLAQEKKNKPVVRRVFVLSIVTAMVVVLTAAFTTIQKVLLIKSDPPPTSTPSPRVIEIGTSFIDGDSILDINNGHQQQQNNSTSGVVMKAVLLPTAMDLLRRNISVSLIYNFPQRTFTGDCSCLNPKSNYTCCGRRIRRSHKMGQIMSKHLFQNYTLQTKRRGRPYQEAYADGLPDNDYRDVLLIRNIYSALVSGYLFHKSGKECSDDGHEGELSVKRWYSRISYESSMHRNHRSMCKFLAEESEEVGMRAYMEWVFRYHYAGIFSQWALAEGLPEVHERTLTICYENMMSPDGDQQAIDSILDFWFNGTSHEPYSGVLPGHQVYMGGHSTSHNETLRIHLIDVVKAIDEKYYGGEIAWVNSVLPC